MSPTSISRNELLLVDEDNGTAGCPNRRRLPDIDEP